MKNITINNYSGNFLDSTNPKTILITSSAFKNLNLIEVTPFIKISGTNQAKTYTHSINDTIFQNISLKTTLILAQDGLMNIKMTNLMITDITKKTIINKSTEYLDIEAQWPGGICLLGKNGISLTIKQSKIMNLNSHCIGLKYSTMTLTSVVFTNAALRYEPTQISENQVDDSSGVSWINFHAGTQDIIPQMSIRITSCQFIENKIYSKCGGVSLYFSNYTNLQNRH